MLFCIPDIAILFISISSCKHANFVIKKSLLGYNHFDPPTKLRGKKQKTKIRNLSERAPRDFINYKLKLLVNKEMAEFSELYKYKNFCNLSRCFPQWQIFQHNVKLCYSDICSKTVIFFFFFVQKQKQGTMKKKKDLFLMAYEYTNFLAI